MALSTSKKMLTLKQASAIYRDLCVKISLTEDKIVNLSGNTITPFVPVVSLPQLEPAFTSLRSSAEACTKASRHLDNLRDELHRLENHVESEADRLLRNLAERHAIKIKR